MEVNGDFGFEAQFSHLFFPLYLSLDLGFLFLA
jgi:hypothetical protein